MKDFNGYLQRMEKSLADKLFFLEYVDLNNYDYVLDFGCANGALIKTCAMEFEKTIFLGYDTSEKMITTAKNECKQKNVRFFSNINDVLDKLNSKKFLIIFSSVLHEVSQNELDSIISLMQKSQTVVIRDMFFDKNQNKDIDCSQILKDKLEDEYLKQFESLYGKIDNLKNLYHYFLKYTYTQNWQTELLENYFGIDYDKIIDSLTKSGFYIFYDEQYTLPFKKAEIAQNFAFDLTLPTHRKLIITRKECKK